MSPVVLAVCGALMLSSSLLCLTLSLVPASEQGAPAVLAGVLADTELALQRGQGMKSMPLTPQQCLPREDAVIRPCSGRRAGARGSFAERRGVRRRWSWVCRSRREAHVLYEVFYGEAVIGTLELSELLGVMGLTRRS